MTEVDNASWQPKSCSLNTGNCPIKEFTEGSDCGVSGVEGDGGEIGDGCEEKLSSEDDDTLRRCLDKTPEYFNAGSDSLCVREGRSAREVEGQDDDGDDDDLGPKYQI